MKIAFIGAAVSIHTVKFVNRFADLGHEVTLFSLSCHKAGENTIDRRVKLIYLQAGGALGYYLNAGRLRKQLAEGRFDVINAHYASGYGTLARRAKAKPLVLSVWGSDVYDFPHRNPINYHIVKKNLEYAGWITSTSAIMAEEVKRLLTKSDRTVEVVPFGVDLSLFHGKRQEQPSHRPLRIGVVKSLKPIYGIDTILQAVAELMKETGKTVQLIICGDGPERQRLNDLAALLQIADNVIWGGSF